MIVDVCIFPYHIFQDSAFPYLDSLLAIVGIGMAHTTYLSYSTKIDGDGVQRVFGKSIVGVCCKRSGTIGASPIYINPVSAAFGKGTICYLNLAIFMHDQIARLSSICSST